MKMLGKLYQWLRSVIGKQPSSTASRAILDTEEDLRRFLPTFLSQGSEDAFLKEIRSFLGSQHKPFYTSALTEKEMLFQGDGIQGLLLMNLPDTTVKPGRAFLLSNTCDVDPSNKRLFETSLTYAPIFRLQTYRTTLIEKGIPEQRVDNHIADLQRQLITQIFFLPKGARLEEDSFVFLDRAISASSKTVPQNIPENRLFTLSDFGAWLLALKLSIHFCRIRDQVDRNEGKVA